MFSPKRLVQHPEIKFSYETPIGRSEHLPLFRAAIDAISTCRAHRSVIVYIKQRLYHRGTPWKPSRPADWTTVLFNYAIIRTIVARGVFGRISEEKYRGGLEMQRFGVQYDSLSFLEFAITHTDLLKNVPRNGLSCLVIIAEGR
jgi:hypothetical protein